MASGRALAARWGRRGARGRRPHQRVRERLAERLGGYQGLPEHAEEGFAREAGLGQLAGACGALALAEAALARAPPRG